MDAGEDIIMRDNDIFDHSLRDFSNNQQDALQQPKQKEVEDLEEEKDDGTGKR